MSSVNMVILLGCVCVCALRAYKKGVWRAALGLLGFLCAYLVSFLATPYLGAELSDKGAQGIIALGVALIVIFIVVSNVVVHLPGLLFPSIRRVSQGHRIAGALIGVATGVVVAVVLIWASSVVTALLSKNGKPPEPDFLSETSSSLVSGVVHSGVTLMEEDPFKASATAAFISAPHKFSSALTELSASPELKTFWQDATSQFYMAEADIDKVMAQPSFKRLVKAPAMQQVLAEGKPNNSSMQDAERYLAQQMSFVWRRMRALRTDPRVVEILEDPEVKKLVDDKDPKALLASEKIQSLIKIVMEEPLEENLAKAVLPSEPQVENAPPEKQFIYKWRDDKGVVRYTDPDNTPEDKKTDAELIVH